MSQSPNQPPTKQNPSNGKLEGEGSYTATRRYNEKLAEHQATQNVEELAENAREAVDGEEGEELRRAEQAGKRGPTQKKTS